jgi:hypothetical protein
MIFLLLVKDFPAFSEPKRSLQFSQKSQHMALYECIHPYAAKAWYCCCFCCYRRLLLVLFLITFTQGSYNYVLKKAPYIKGT